MSRQCLIANRRAGKAQSLGARRRQSADGSVTNLRRARSATIPTMGKKAKVTGVATKSPGKNERGERQGGGMVVRDSRGRLHPFLRGMVTHDLVQRGLPFDEAYEAARGVKERLGKREEISTTELRDAIEAHLLDTLGEKRLATLAPSGWPRTPEVVVHYHGQPQPFSRGLLARSLQAAGLDLDRSYRLVTELQGELRREKVTSLSSEEVARRAGALLERTESAAAATRYRLVRRVQRLPRPLVIYLGGATGTGKSTLALGMAPLLRIYRINATDTIRQVMRMLFAPAILPALHASSFEVAGVGETSSGLPAGFVEQATRVCVGVRAVVERAIVENMNIVVEGVHLLPGLVPFPDLEGAVHQVSLMLTTLSEDTHRGRFLARSRTAPRSAERYIEHFEAIRALQSRLVEQAEAHHVPILDTSDSESTLPRALRLVAGLLEERLPWLGRAEDARGRVVVPTLLLVIDGLADRPSRALGSRTPVEAAQTPHLDRLAKGGRVGLADPVAPGSVPDTAAGALALFGQAPYTMQRGPVEALSTGLELQHGDVALRGNLATCDAKGRLTDRRAGRIREETTKLALALDGIRLTGPDAKSIEVRVRPATEHRLSIVLKGAGLSDAVQGSDPGDGAPPGPPLEPRALDPRDRAAVRTAKVLAAFEKQARRVLGKHPVNVRRRQRGQPEANAILTRGAGRVLPLPPLEVGGLPLRHVCISGDQTFLGLAGWLGGERITAPEMTANLDSDVTEKFRQAVKALTNHDLVVLHVKGADIAAHDLRPDLKVKFIEQLDKALGWLLSHHKGPLRIAVASDHATLSETGHHAADPVPVLIWGTGVKPDAVKTFSERAATQGALGRFPLQLLLERVFEAG